MSSSTRSSGSSGRCLPTCPGWPPGRPPEPGFRARGGAEGGSCEGGSDELRELRFSRCSSSLTRASSNWFRSISSPTATTARPPSRDRPRGSPPPRPAPHPRIRHTKTGPFREGERLPFFVRLDLHGQLTMRVTEAMRNPSVHAISHPKGGSSTADPVTAVSRSQRGRRSGRVLIRSAAG
jgi:hypothetical protein